MKTKIPLKLLIIEKARAGGRARYLTKRRIVSATAALLFLSTAIVGATTFNIPNGDVAALKNAINVANTNSVPDTINLAANGTYTLVGVDNHGQDNPSDQFRGDNGLPVVRNDVATDTFVDLVINGNGATITPYGGGSYRVLHIRGGASCTINNLRFYNAHGYNGSGNPNDEFYPSPGGAAFFNDASKVTLYGCTFESNVMAADPSNCLTGGGDASGGAIYNTGVLNATSCVFTNNRTEGGAQASGPCYYVGASRGGAIFSSTETLTVTNCTFTNNSVHTGIDYLGNPTNDGVGGSIMTPGGYFANDTLNGGSAGQGAAISFSSSLNSTVTGCSMSNNIAGASGGAIAAAGGSNLTITGCTFNANKAGYRGGAIQCYAAGMTIADCTFDGNQTTSDMQYVENEGGGAIYYYGSSVSYYQDLKITNTRFTDNRAGYNGSEDRTYGGAILFDMINARDDFGSTTLTTCTFSGNHALRGGGIYLLQRGLGPTTVTLTDSAISNNHATEEGGGIYVTNRSEDGTSARWSYLTLYLTNCTLSGNQLHPVYYGYGGGLMNWCSYSGATSAVVITNSTFSANSATNGTAIANFSNNPQPTSSDSVSLRNTIVNAGTGGDNIYNSDNVPTAKITSLGHNISSDAAGGNTGTGPGGFLNAAGDKRNTNPMIGPLAYNGGPTQTHALQAGSPAINAGAGSQPDRDQRAYLRTGAVDIGAFESGGTLAPIAASSNKNQGTNAFAVDFPLTGPIGVECRSGGANGNYSMILSFATPVTIGSASVTTGVGGVNGLLVNGSHASVLLTGVANAQQITVTLFNVNDGVHANNATIPARFLQGDTTGDGVVNSADISQTKSKSGQTVDITNFRNDVNADGTLNSADISLVKSKSGTAVP